ncbi:MAG TPA: HAD-IA family hydrolase [Bryobacteraceae bacterium]|jgi:phosphoglycolate phosphatase|nr:HAD-IA family hydrolase [Bryobacteraceae bacterium]
MSVPQFSAYLFDVDGTLVDSATDICGAIQAVLATTRQSSVPDDLLRRYIGRHLYDLFGDLLPECTREQMDQMLADYRRIYLARNHTLTRAYAGIANTLSALPGKKSTATTKGTPTTRSVLELFGLLSYFDHVQGTDGFPAKPEPDVIFASLKVLRVAAEDCLLVGDSPADMEAGRRAHVKTCAVLWGYGRREDLAKWEPDYWISDPRELLSGAGL